MPDKPESSLTVVADDYRFPFSRGLMARSLIRAGIPTDEAYDIASSVQESLLDEGVHEIKRHKLKQRAIRIIRERYGDEAAGRYERWKRRSEDIYIGDENEREPFSRGLLAQSLLAAGLSPDIAHEVAERMRGELIEREISRISRDELRSMTYRMLERDFGENYATHYLVWRRLKGPEKPLVLLFGGATGTGKSSMSVEIAHRLGITRVIGTDTIREIMRGMFSKELMPSIHESSYSVWKTLSRPLGQADPDPMISAFQEQTQRVMVGVNSIIRRAIAENLSMIIEGVHLVPDGTTQEFGSRAIIIPIMICTEDDKLHRRRFVTRAQEARHRSSRKYLRNYESIRKIQAALIKTARETDTFMVDNVDFDDSVRKIIRFLTKRMAELVDLDYTPHENIREA